MNLQPGPINTHIDGIQVVHKKNRMGIADIHPDRILERAGANPQMKGVHFAGEGNILPGGAQPAHFHRHLFFTCPSAGQPSSKGVDDNFLVLAFLQQKPAHTPGGISTGFDFATVRIKDPHKGAGSVRSRFGSGRIYNQQFVAPNPFPAVANPSDLFSRRPVRFTAAVDDNEIVAQAVHLNKGPAAPDNPGAFFNKRDVMAHELVILRDRLYGPLPSNFNFF